MLDMTADQEEKWFWCGGGNGSANHVPKNKRLLFSGAQFPQMSSEG